MHLMGYVALCIAGTGLSFVMGLIAFRKRPAPGATETVVLMVFIGIWCFTSIFEAIAVTQAGKALWSAISYIGSQTTSVFFFLFVLQTIGREKWISTKRTVFLLIVPTIQIILSFTNDSHRLIWSSIELESIPGGIVGVYERGSLFWVNSAYAYSLVIISVFLLFRYVITSRDLFLRQSTMIIIGCAFPFITSIQYIMDNRVIGGFDPTPLSFVVSISLIAWATLRFGLLKVSPIAWEQVAMNLIDGLLVVDRENYIINWNSTLADWLEPVRLNVGTKASRALVHWPRLQKLGMDNPQESVELEEHSPKDRVFHVDATVLSDRMNRYIGRAFLFRDVTKLKQTQRFLEKARKDALLANQVKSQFIATVSHELRNPLHAVTGLLTLLEPYLTTEEQRTYLDRISIGVDSLRTIINDILDLSKLEAGKMVLEKAPFSLRELIERIQNLFEPIALKKGIRFQMDPVFFSDVVYLGDSLRIHQILSNLFSNALKFTDQGYIQFRVEPEPQQIRFTISDSGIGMSDQYLEKLFTPYTQADSSTGRQYGGTGLGLSICKSLIDAMEGRIEVVSKVGEGSQFVVELPLQQQKGKEGLLDFPTKRIDKTSLFAPEPIFHSKRVLLIEDEESNAKLMREILMKKEVLVDIADTGRKALRFGETCSYDLIITDYYLPDMNGPELLEKFSQIPGFVAKIVVLSGSSKEETERLAQDASVEMVLHKPLPPEELFAALRSIWGEIKGEPIERKEQTHERPIPHIDVARGIEMTGGDPEMHKELLTIFLRSLEEEWIPKFDLRNPWEDIRPLVHKIKGAAALVGAIDLADMCKTVEEMEKNGQLELLDTDHRNRMRKKLDQEIRSLVACPELKSYISHPTDPLLKEGK